MGDYHHMAFAAGETGASSTSLKIVNNKKIFLKREKNEEKKRKTTTLPHSFLSSKALSASARWGWEFE